MDRNRLQELAANTLYKDSRLLCMWATGCGKSQVALKFLQAHPEATCLILVPEQNNIQNWEYEFDKFCVPRDKVTIACYASFHKYKGTEWTLLVLDEVSHIDTEKRREISHSVIGDYVLALGAVVDQDEIAAIENVFGSFKKSVISLERAIEWGILPPPTVNVYHIVLDNEKKEHWKNGRVYTAKGMYDVLQQKVDEAVSAYEHNPNKFNQSRMFRAGMERKRFLGKIKEEHIQMICEELENRNKRFICFCSSIAQAEKLGKDHAFTSKTPTKLKLLDKFNNHEIDSLYVVSKLIEGQNLKDIDCGVLGQLGGTERITVQSVGRVMRSANPEIFVPVFNDTKDESFLYTLTSNISEEYIKHYNF